MNPIKRLPAPPASPSAQGNPGRRFGFNIGFSSGFYLALSILLLVTGAGWGQGGTWSWLTGNNLRGVKFLKGTDEGWAVGQRGLILHTTDGGDHWEVQNSNTDQDLWGMFFLDQNHGWVTGGYKTCLRTRDGGRNWQVIHTEPSGFSHFKGVCFLDTMVGWVVGPYDSIFKSTDGGVTWNGQWFNIMDYYFDITFPEPLYGWAISSGRISHTTDGGISWRDTSVLGLSGMYDVDFTDSLRGLVVGYATVGRTSDGGTTWVLNNPVNQYLYGLSMADTLQSYACGGHNGNLAVLLRTTNGGISWLAQNMTNDHALFGVSAPEAIKAYTVGESGSILKTTNGGIGWQILRNLDAQNETMFNLALADTQSGYAVGPYGIVVKTTNGGTVWQRQNLGGTSLWFYGLDAPDPNYAWACGDGGSIYATKNGGTSWASQNSGVGWFLNSVDMVDTLFGVSVGGGYGKDQKAESRNDRSGDNSPPPKAVGEARSMESPQLINKWEHIKEGQKNPKAQYRVITRILDGTNWQGVTSGDTPLNGVSFVNKAQGWACGVSGTVIHTSDSGATWQAQNSNVTNTLYWIKFPDALHGWAVGSGGTIIATTDGGNTWTRQTSNTGLGLYSVGFADSLRGWVVGDSGLALGTTDGGTTWMPDTTRTSIPLYALSATDRDHGWTIGGFGLTLGFGRAGQVGIETRGQGEGETRRLETALGQSYPNPTKGIASLEYELGKPGKVIVRVYNVAGQAVRTLIEGLEPAGRHVVVWDGKDTSGRKAGSGTYFFCLEAGDRKAVRKMVVIR